jgi:hypothetical protein
MLQNSPASLASALDAGRDLSARFVFGAEQSVAWSELLSGSCLDRRASELRGRSILIETMDQLAVLSCIPPIYHGNIFPLLPVPQKRM